MIKVRGLVSLLSMVQKAVHGVCVPTSECWIPFPECLKLQTILERKENVADRASAVTVMLEEGNKTPLF